MNTMFSWLPSWLPSLPSGDYFSLPSSIQGRFISFVLKRTLGHFLKPGQLDPQQIDSQVGSGYIQINDLEVDTSAVNELLQGLPLALESGTIGSVTARIPWPNPLTAAVGFSLNSLHVTLHVQQDRTRTAQVDLSDSIASYAQSFIHEELESTEEDVLEESLRIQHHSNEEDHNVPGGINPFLDTPEELDKADIDPDGISLFAVLIERLLARFQGDAKDTRITVFDPASGGSMTLSVAEIRYHTDVSEVDEGRGPRTDESEGEVRKLIISGLSVNVRQSIQNCPAKDSSPGATGSPSPASSESSMDADAQWTMSQSIAFLPPRSGSPDSAVSASMYQSAFSTDMPPDSNVIPRNTPSRSHRNSSNNSSPDVPSELSDTLMSFGPESIVVQLTTPPLRTINTSHQFNVKLSVKVGTIRIMLRAWHMRCLLQLASAITAYPSVPPPTGTNELSSSSGSGIQLSLDIGGIVLLLLPHPPSKVGSPNSTLDRFFSHPLALPPFLEDCFRLHVERISLETSINNAATTRNIATLSSTLTVGDIALFSFHPDYSGQDGEASVIAIPVLITDPLLPTQYLSQHVHPGSVVESEEIKMPLFGVVDWTSNQAWHYGTKISSWRTKQKQMKSLHGSRWRSSAPDSGQTDLAVHIRLERRSPATNKSSSSIDVDANIVSPLHLFLDLRWIALESGILAFINEISYALRTDVPPGTPQQDPVSQRKAVQSQALKDLDLHLNYLEEGEVASGFTGHAAAKESLLQKHSGSRKKPLSSSRIVIGTPMIRVQTRCPPGVGHNPRSGAVILDVRDVKVVVGEGWTPKVTSFSQPSGVQTLEGKILLLVELGMVVLSFASPASDKATALLSLGSLVRTGGLDESHNLPDVRPRIAITQSEPRRLHTSVTTALNLDFPSVVINLSKPAFDGLQYWADDVSQTLQLALEKDVTGENGSRDTSIIGSRYFAQSTRGGDASVVAQSKERKDEFVIKALLHEAFVRISLLRQQEEEGILRPVDIVASDIDMLVEVKSEGRDQTFVTVSATDLSVINHTSSRENVTLFSLASPRDPLLISKPVLKLRFTSLLIPGTIFKESKIRLSLWGFIYNFSHDTSWMTDLAIFASAPPGAFETVVPSERTSLFVKVTDGAIQSKAPHHPGTLIVHMGELEFATELIGNAATFNLKLLVPSLALLAIDDVAECIDSDLHPEIGVTFWTKRGHALLAEVANLKLSIESNKKISDMKVTIDQVGIRLHLCADTMAAVTAFIDDLVSAFTPVENHPPPKRRKRPTVIAEDQGERNTDMFSSVDDLAFKRVPQIGHAPDMIYDDLPTNPDYLDESFGAAAGLRELRDEDLDDFDQDYIGTVHPAEEGQKPGIISKYGGETIRLLRTEGLHVVDDYFDTLPPEDTNDFARLGETTVQVHIRNSDVNVLLYDGYDWAHTRRIVETEVKEMRKRLAKIRQLVANGQTQEAVVEETSTLLFNSVYIGLKQDVDELEPTALMAAIDEELKEDPDTGSQGSGSWQTLPTPPGKVNSPSTRPVARRLARSRGSNIEFQAAGLNATFDQYKPMEQLVSKVFATIENLEILDHIKTSTWKKFLTALRADSRGNIRETGSSMVRFELRTLKPVPEDPSEENRLRLKILPLRLHVDQDALDFLKKFFGFKDPRFVSAPSDPDEGTYFQLAEVFPVDLKLDYKPRRVDYRALREGRTIELMNFFHFDGAEMTLRHITLSGINGWARLGELLNDLWTPDVKATQLVDVISGVSPIRSVVNVGSGIADLVLLPISQYKKDGRIVRGVQKGTEAFVKSTAAEAIKLGARLATGTQVILEQAEGVLGTEFKHPITAETLQIFEPAVGINVLDKDDFTEEEINLVSKYAEQPMNLQEGIHSAYKSLQKNFNSAAQTILAVPMEVYERSGSEGPVRSVIRAVPIAVLRPMIGASEAVSKTLLGLHNQLDPNLRHDHDDKYKHR